MKIEKKDTFDPSGYLWIKNERRVDSRLPIERQHNLTCGKCAEPWELADEVLTPNPLFCGDPAYTRHPLGVKCPKCGLHQAVGQLSHLSIWEIPAPRPHKTLNEIADYADNAHLFGRRVNTAKGSGKVTGWEVVYKVTYDEPDAEKGCSGMFNDREVELM